MSIYGIKHKLETDTSCITPNIQEMEGMPALTYDQTNKKLIFNDNDIMVDGKINGKVLAKNFSSLTGEEIREGDISDGYHTFDELYDHRITLYLSLIASLKNNSMIEVW